jgi:hypothetical protein
MRALTMWLCGCSLLTGFVACSSAQSSLSGGGGGANQGSDDGGDDASDNGFGGGGSGSGGFVDKVPEAAPLMVADSACKAGFYQGKFTGTYSSHITVVGVGIPVQGNVEMTLNQQGSSNTQCTINVQGEGVTTESCNDVFTVSGGTISGVADGLFPYYCTMTGTLDCAKKVLENGWIECTYCAIGAIPDGGDKASTDPLAVCEGAGGNFAGVFQANYDTSTLSFTDGVWNGAEDLCTGIGGTPFASCNDGGSPGPEGGAPTNYLRLDAGYGLAPNYGGSGNWTAGCLDCEHD